MTTQRGRQEVLGSTRRDDRLSQSEASTAPVAEAIAALERNVGSVLLGKPPGSLDDELSAGSYKATWDATDKTGSQVSSGVYFYRMQAGDFTDTRSMTLLK